MSTSSASPLTALTYVTPSGVIDAMSPSFGNCTQRAVVLDDPVQHDRELVVVAGGEGMRVLLGDAAVRRPARMTEAGARDRTVRAGGLRQVREVPDRAHVFETVLFEERDSGRVV